MNNAKVIEDDSCFAPLEWDKDTHPLPTKFTFPFSYEPHPVAISAIDQLQDRIDKLLASNDDINMFDEGGLGKMFGVLIVLNTENELGYLSAFSGKWGSFTVYPGFVKPVYDHLEVDGYYKKGEAKINMINREIERLEADSTYVDAIQLLKELNENAIIQIEEYKADLNAEKSLRKTKRTDARTHLTPEEYTTLCQLLDQESIHLNYKLKDLQKHWKYRIDEQSVLVQKMQEALDRLKQERRSKSGMLQAGLHRKYNFLNGRGESKNLFDIFQLIDDVQPPSGSGECAAPKLLQHAFAYDYTPIAMAEFWWGKSPASEVRKHGLFYPACNGKCKPILGHMLEGLDVDDNPMLINPAEGKSLIVIYEDDYLLVINKPSEFLSVPGKNINDSVYSRMRELFPDATGPLVVHRLDMSTSGVMLIAKRLEIHNDLQKQFINRQIKKKYTALLDGEVEQKKGTIELPLRVDIDDRPRQLVCYQHGKKATTYYQVVDYKDGKTRVFFYPITGRTHQLRVHASHPLGLNTPIIGDDIYGTISERLFLHATSITFTHPITKKEMTVKSLPDF